MAQSKKHAELGEPNIKRILETGRIESELDHERIMLADRQLMHQEKLHPELRATRKVISDMIVEFEARCWSHETCVTDAQMEESEAAENQAEKEYAFLWKRNNLILAKLQELSLKQKDLALLLNHSKSYTSELLNGIRPFSTNDLKLIHLLFEIPLKDLIITIPSQETLSRLETAIEKISALNPKAKLLHETLVNRPVAKGFLPENWYDDDASEETGLQEPVTEELTLSNK